MSDTKKITDTIRALKIVGNIWLVVTALLILSAYVGMIFQIGDILPGAKKILSILSPSHARSYFLLFVGFAPGIILRIWARRIEKRLLSEIEVIYG